MRWVIKNLCRFRAEGLELKERASESGLLSHKILTPGNAISLSFLPSQGSGPEEVHFGKFVH